MKKITLLIVIFGFILETQAQDQSVNGKLHVKSNADVGVGQTPALLIGDRSGLHIGIDGNEIGAFSNNENAILYLNGSQSPSNTIINGEGTGSVGIGTMNPSARLHINSGSDVGRGQNPAVLIGFRDGYHIAIDDNEIGAFNNNENSVLYLNGSQSTSNTIINGEGTGNVGIGTHDPQHKLDVCGTIRAQEVIVEEGWCDYVFEPEYCLTTLEEEAEFIKLFGHLSNFESAKTMDGLINVNDIFKRQQIQIEENVLHLIELSEENKALQTEVDELKAGYALVIKEIADLKAQLK